jgi:hypothetical protein
MVTWELSLARLVHFLAVRLHALIRRAVHAQHDAREHGKPPETKTV